MLAWMDPIAPHVVCLQEVESGDTGGETVAEQLAAALRGDWHVEFGGRLRSPGTVIGNAVLSRWPLGQASFLELPCDDSYAKGVLHARTCGIDVFSVHLTAAPDGAEIRERQAVQLDEFVRERSDPNSVLPPIIAGDFNATPGSSAVRFLRGEQSLHGRSTFYQDAWAVAGDGGPGHTWSRHNPNTPPAWLYDARCDYILVGTPRVPIGWSTGNPQVNPVGQIASAELICTSSRTGVFASDHYGLAASIHRPHPPEYDESSL